MIEEFQRAIEQLFGRISGPMYFRLIIQPIMAMLFAIRAGRRDAREDHLAFLERSVSNPAERQKLIHSAWKDVGRVMIFAFIMDVIYQTIELKSFYLLQALIIVVVLAILPYILTRGPVTRIMRRYFLHKDRSHIERRL